MVIVPCRQLGAHYYTKGHSSYKIFNQHNYLQFATWQHFIFITCTSRDLPSKHPALVYEPMNFKRPQVFNRETTVFTSPNVSAIPTHAQKWTKSHKNAVFDPQRCQCKSRLLTINRSWWMVRLSFNHSCIAETSPVCYKTNQVYQYKETNTTNWIWTFDCITTSN